MRCIFCRLRIRPSHLTLILLLWIPLSVVYIRHASNDDIDNYSFNGMESELERVTFGNDKAGNDKTRRLLKDDDYAVRELRIIANYDKTPNGDPLDPGEGGKAVRISKLDKEEEDAGYEQHAFNRLASDRISLERSLKDVRSSR